MIAQYTTTTTSSSRIAAAFASRRLVYLAIAVIAIIAWVKILNKAGYSGVWVLVGLVPIVNIVMFLVFAFADWPALRGGGGGRQYFAPGPPPDYSADPRYGYG